jgi:hypothetical protein
MSNRMTCRAKPRPNSGGGGRRPGLLRRIIDAVFESDRHRIDREMAALLTRSGGRFTDAIEREAFERQFVSNWWSQP